MAQDTVRRRMAPILVADVVGYSRLMGEDETATLHALQGHRFALIDPTIGQYQGRIVKVMGDGVLVEFQSVHDAVECAIAIQQGMIYRNTNTPEKQQIRFRMGINLGDVIIEDDDIYGDDVNIAARLQEIAEPNGICITTAVFEHIDREVNVSFEDLGAHKFKNIAKPIRVYHHGTDTAANRANTAFRPFVDLPFQSKALIKGGCLCGNIRYELSEEPLGSMLCHCRMCQKFSGAPILGGTTFLSDALHFTTGSPAFYKSSNIAERGFCSDCGTALVYRGLNGVWTKWTMVFTASLDEPEKYPPTYHMGMESTMPWLDIHDHLPRSECKDSPSLIAAYASVGEEVPK